MSFFKLRMAPGSVWPPLCDPAVSQVWSVYQEIDQTQWLDPAALEEGQLRQVRALLAHSAAHVPYYRRVLREAGVEPAKVQSMEEFRRVPLLPRRTYQEKLAHFRAERLPDGTLGERTVQTSGSSGSPTTTWQTNMTTMWWHVFFLRDMEWCGIDMTGRLGVIRSTAKREPELSTFMNGMPMTSWSGALRPLLEMGTGAVMDIGQDHRRQLQWLRELKPDYLVSYPANLEVLAAMVRSEGRLPGLKAIKAISDTLTDEAQQRIEEGFGVPVKNLYSCTEAGYLASTCPSGQGLHVYSENVLLEVLDANGKPCAPGESGHVYITSLNNFQGPLLRYELGDVVTLAPGTPGTPGTPGIPGRCACGRGLPLLARVQGKDSPMFWLGGGRRKGSTRLAFLMRKVGGHWQHQVVQKAVGHVVVRIVPDPAWSDDHAQQVRRCVEEFFEGPMRIDIEMCERLAVPPTGKFQNMVVEMG